MTGRRLPFAGLAERAPGERRLEGPALHYVKNVLRLRAGDSFFAFDPAAGVEADAMLLEDDGIRLGPPRPGAVAPTAGLVWVQALAKGDKCDAVVRDATELGATRIVVAVSTRSVVKLDAERAGARAERWTRIAREAARQCGRSDAPRIDGPWAWDEALARVDETHARFCLWERASEPLGPALAEAMAHRLALAFACGPEGGLEIAEVELARARGWSIASLGSRILRTETVAAAVLGAVAIGAQIPARLMRR